LFNLFFTFFFFLGLLVLHFGFFFFNYFFQFFFLVVEVIGVHQFDQVCPLFWLFLEHALQEVFALATHENSLIEFEWLIAYLVDEFIFSFPPERQVPIKHGIVHAADSPHVYHGGGLRIALEKLKILIF